jgi:Uma2 family endonuclease
MATASNKKVVFETAAEMLERLGNVPLQRILMKPAPGTAREKDVLAAERQSRKRLCELIDGVLVEKVMGARESLLTSPLIHQLEAHAEESDIGVVLGEAGMLQLFPGQVRIPDVSFISWERIPGGVFPAKPIPNIVPNLAIEVLSPSNTKKEMERKLRDYFFAGVELVWLINPRTQTAEVYTSPTDVQRIGKSGSLDGGRVLPGFRLPLKRLFARLARRKGSS